MVCEGTYFFPININSHYHVLQKKFNNRTVCLKTIINGYINVTYYDCKDVVPTCLQSIPNNDYSEISPLHIIMEEHDNIMNENNQV